MPVRIAALLVALPGAFLAACQADIGTPPGGDGVDAAPGPGPGGSPQHVRYRGTLAATPAAAFGGSGYCDYSVTLRDVVFDVVVRASDELTSMSIDDRMVEATVGSCPYEPQSPSQQHFTHDSNRPIPVTNDGTFAPLLTGDPANRPMTAATATVTLATETTVQVSARWERTDQPPPLSWVVTTAAPVTLTAATCTPGALVCVGGGQGLLYSCADGTRMSPVRLCAAGCAASQDACD